MSGSPATRLAVADWFHPGRVGRSVVVFAARNGPSMGVLDGRGQPVPAGAATVVTVSPFGRPDAEALCYGIPGRPGRGTVGPLPPLPNVPPGATVEWREGVVRWVDLLAGTFAEAVRHNGLRLMCLSTEMLFHVNEDPDGTVRMVETDGHQPR